MLLSIYSLIERPLAAVFREVISDNTTDYKIFFGGPHPDTLNYRGELQVTIV